MTATNRNKRKLEAALEARYEGANLLSFDDHGIIFNLPEDANRKYCLKFQLKNGEIGLAEERQAIVEEIVIPEPLSEPELDLDPCSAIVGTPRAKLDPEEIRMIYGIKFSPRKGQKTPDENTENRGGLKMSLVYRTYKNETPITQVFLDYSAEPIKILPGETKSFVVDSTGPGGGDYDDAAVKARLAALEAAQSLKRIYSWSGAVNQGAILATGLSSSSECFALLYTPEANSVVMAGFNGTGYICLISRSGSPCQGSFYVSNYAKGTSGKINVYQEGGVLCIENKWSGAITLSVAAYQNQ
jgi:hypothetical protein